ncbi:hypothetical protein RCH14_004426 [Massilia sp. MP_M2]
MFMQVTIKTDSETLAELDLTVEQFEHAASQALSSFSHPETGDTIYFNGVSVAVTLADPKAA